MSDSCDQKSIPTGKLTKKMSKKGTSQIPLDTLGFKAKVFYDSVYEYVPRRKPNKYAKFENQKRQMNFRSKLSCIIDPSHATYQEIGDMKFNKRSQWKKIKYIIYRTKQLLTCCICLTKEFVAPQMTFCGHVFCWHCLLMHYEKSLKANYCPVCNQVFEIEEIRTCDTVYLPPISQGQKVKLKLKMRNLDQKVTFNPQNLQQETTFSHVIRMKNSNSLQKYISQHQQIIKEMKVNDDPQNQRYLNKVLVKSQARIDELKNIIQQQKNFHYKPHKHEVFNNGILCQVLLLQDLSTDKIMAFYQQEQGRYVYLHPICQKYLRKNFSSDQLPLRIQEEIIYKQETQYSSQNLKRYRYLNHLPENQDFDFVFIRMNGLLDYKLLDQFEKEFENYKHKQHEILQRQEEYAKLLNEKYEKDQNYLRELKKMQQSEFHDIKVPTNMVDLAEIQDTNIFPSLVQTPSQSESASYTESSQTSEFSGVFESSKNRSKKNKFKIKEEDFPGLELAVKMSLDETQFEDTEHFQNIGRKLSADPPMEKLPTLKKELTESDFPDLASSKQRLILPIKSKGKKDDDQQDRTNKRKGKKKNKQKFVDVTSQFFQRQEDE